MRTGILRDDIPKNEKTEWLEYLETHPNMEMTYHSQKRKRLTIGSYSFPESWYTDIEAMEPER